MLLMVEHLSVKLMATQLVRHLSSGRPEMLIKKQFQGTKSEIMNKKSSALVILLTQLTTAVKKKIKNCMDLLY